MTAVEAAVDEHEAAIAKLVEEQNFNGVKHSFDEEIAQMKSRIDAVADNAQIGGGDPSAGDVVHQVNGGGPVGQLVNGVGVQRIDEIASSVNLLERTGRERDRQRGKWN